MNIQQTSIEAYREIHERLGERQKIVLQILSEIGEANNMMISRKLNIPINQVTPRMNELRKKGIVVESYRDLCPFTRRHTIYWKVRGKSTNNTKEINYPHT